MADGLKVRGDLLFRNGNAEGEVGLADADIGGNLSMRPLDVQKRTVGRWNRGWRLRVSGDGFRVDGEVRLIGADVGGNFECDKGTFKNAGRYRVVRRWNQGGRRRVSHAVASTPRAKCDWLEQTLAETSNAKMASSRTREELLSLPDGIKVGGDVFLTDCFIIEGEVRLVGADIGGNLGCDRVSNVGGLRSLTTIKSDWFEFLRAGVGQRTFLVAEGRMVTIGCAKGRLEHRRFTQFAHAPSGFRITGGSTYGMRLVRSNGRRRIGSS